MAQQIAGRAPNVLDFFQMRALARRTPRVVERDIEGENRLKIELVQAIADLEKTKADIKKGVISGMTDMATKFAQTQASMLSALASEAQAQASTRGAMADVLKLNNKLFADARGVLASGTPEEDFMKRVMDPAGGITPVQTAMTSALTNPDNELAGLIAELTPAEGSPALVGAGFDGLVNALDEAFVTGPNGMVGKLAPIFRQSANQQLAVPNAIGAMQQVDAAISGALANADMPDAAKQQVRAELRLRAAQRIQNDVVQATGSPDLFSKFSETQSEALQGMRRDTEDQLRRMGVGINAKTKQRLLNNLEEITGMLVSNDPFAQTQVAADRLSKKGVTPPPPLAPGADAATQAAHDAQKKEYEAQLRNEVAATIPMEGFAQRLANLPVAPEIDKQIDYLKGLLGQVGVVPQDALVAATGKLRQSMGDAQFDAWRRMVGAGTDEDAAIAAAKDPTKLSVFRRVAGTEQRILTNPEQYRKVVSTEAANEAGAARQAARQSATAYAAEGQAVPQPQLPSEPAPSPGRVVPRTQEEQAAREASMPLPEAGSLGAPAPMVPQKFDVSQWSQSITEDLNDGVSPADAAAARKAQGPMGMAAPGQQFQTALATTTGQRSQLFGAGGLMAKRARGGT